MRTLAIALETLGVIAIIVGVAVEATLRAPIGFVAITGGAALIAAGGLIWTKLMRKK